MHSTWFRSTFLRLFKFLPNTEGGPNFCREQMLRKISIILSLLQYLKCKIFRDPESLSFLRFQCVQHDSEVLFQEQRNFHQLKRGNQFCKYFELFRAPFCILVLKVVGREVLRHLLDFDGFFLIREYLSQSFQISTN